MAIIVPSSILGCALQLSVYSNTNYLFQRNHQGNYKINCARVCVLGASAFLFFKKRFSLDAFLFGGYILKCFLGVREKVTTLHMGDIKDPRFLTPEQLQIILREEKGLTAEEAQRVALEHPYLEKINFVGFRPIGPDAVVKFAEHCPLLKKIDIDGRNCPIENSHLQQIAEKRPQLTTLSLINRSQIADAGVIALAQCCGELRFLRLERAEVTDQGVKALADHCPNLKRVHLNRCKKITDAAVIEIAKCRNLTNVSFFECDQITDVGVRVLAENRSNLERVYLSGCEKITDAAVEALTANCPSLIEVYLRGCEKITDAAVRALKDKGVTVYS